MSAEAMESTRITILLRGEMRLSRHKLRAKAIGPPNIAGATITATIKASDSIGETFLGVEILFVSALKAL